MWQVGGGQGKERKYKYRVVSFYPTNIFKIQPVANLF
jgi:hypothetical protein